MALVKINEQMLREVITEENRFDNVIETGYIDLDYVTGGLRRKETYLISGENSVEKTSLVLNFVERIGIQKNNNIAYFSLSENKEEILRKLLQVVCKVENFTDSNQLKVERGIRELGLANIYIDATQGDTFIEISEKCNNIDNLDLIIIDDIQKMDVFDNNDEKSVIDNLDVLKQLAIEHDCPIVMTNMISKGRNKRKSLGSSDLQNIRMRRYIDNIWFLDRNNKRKRHAKGNQLVVELNVAQNKHGSKSFVKLAWIPEYLRFCTVDRAEEWENIEKYQFSEVIQ